MKLCLLILLIFVFNCFAMYQSEEDEAKAQYHKESANLCDYQKARNRKLIESMAVYGFKHLNELTEEQKNQRFIECINKQWYISYEHMQCLKTGTAGVFSWLGTGFLAYVFCMEKADAWGNEQCTAEPKKTATVAACAVCGGAMLCVACVSSLLLCDACKGLRWGKKCQKECEHVFQLKMGAKKSE